MNNQCKLPKVWEESELVYDIQIHLHANQGALEIYYIFWNNRLNKSLWNRQGSFACDKQSLYESTVVQSIAGIVHKCHIPQIHCCLVNCITYVSFESREKKGIIPLLLIEIFIFILRKRIQELIVKCFWLGLKILQFFDVPIDSGWCWICIHKISQNVF